MNDTNSRISKKNWGHPLNWFMGSILLVLIIYSIWSGFQKKNQPLHLIVYACSTQKEALTYGIFPAFEQAWEADTGQDVIIEGVFGPSGTLASQIVLGAPTDVAIFSNQRYIDILKFSKVVDRDTDPIMVASTPLVILARSGNLKGLSDFADLAQPGLQLLHGDPTSSGIGEWAILAEYGSAYLETGDPKYAEAQLKDIWQNVRLLGTSARATLTLFELGAGDALVTYEQDAYLARQRGVPVEIIMPERTILARHFAIILDDNVTFVERPIVEAFLVFIQSTEGQQIFSQYYYRPATLENELLPDLSQPFTEEDLGGWTQAYNRLVENFWKTEIEPGLELDEVVTFLLKGE